MQIDFQYNDNIDKLSLFELTNDKITFQIPSNFHLRNNLKNILEDYVSLISKINLTQSKVINHKFLTTNTYYEIVFLECHRPKNVRFRYQNKVDIDILLQTKLLTKAIRKCECLINGKWISTYSLPEL